MNAQAILEDLNKAGIQIAADGDMLRWCAPRGVFTPELRAVVAEHKQEILSLLSAPAREIKVMPLPGERVKLLLPLDTPLLVPPNRVITSEGIVAEFDGLELELSLRWGLAELRNRLQAEVDPEECETLSRQIAELETVLGVERKDS